MGIKRINDRNDLLEASAVVFAWLHDDSGGHEGMSDTGNCPCEADAVRRDEASWRVDGVVYYSVS